MPALLSPEGAEEWLVRPARTAGFTVSRAPVDAHLDRERAPILGSELPKDAAEFGLEALDLVDEHRGDHLGERGVQVIAVVGELRPPLGELGGSPWSAPSPPSSPRPPAGSRRGVGDLRHDRQRVPTGSDPPLRQRRSRQPGAMFRPRLCAVEHADLCGSRPLAPPPIRSSRRGTSPRARPRPALSRERVRQVEGRTKEFLHRHLVGRLTAARGCRQPTSSAPDATRTPGPARP